MNIHKGNSPARTSPSTPASWDRILTEEVPTAAGSAQERPQVRHTDPCQKVFLNSAPNLKLKNTAGVSTAKIQSYVDVLDLYDKALVKFRDDLRERTKPHATKQRGKFPCGF